MRTCAGTHAHARAQGRTNVQVTVLISQIKQLEVKNKHAAETLRSLTEDLDEAKVLVTFRHFNFR